MNTQEFLEWLTTEKKMSSRSAKDVISRYGRVCRMLDIEFLDSDSIEHLQSCEQFRESSMFVKSQLKRSAVLYLEFVKSDE